MIFLNHKLITQVTARWYLIILGLFLPSHALKEIIGSLILVKKVALIQTQCDFLKNSIGGWYHQHN